MKVTGGFFHDLPIYKDVDGNYCSTTLTDDLFKRYFCVVDELYVVTRVYHLDCTYDKAHQEKITLSNVRVIELPNLNKPQYLLTKIPEAEKKIESIIKTLDLVFIRGGIIAMLASKVCRRLNKSYLVEAAGCAWDEYWNHSIAGKIIAPYMESQSRKTIKQADFVIYVTEKYLQKRYPTNGISTYASNVILNSVDDIALEKRLEKIVHRDCKDTWVIGTTAGVNNKAKGQQYVIEAISRLKDIIDIRYELVGTGDNQYLLSVAEKFNVKDQVVFKGELSHAEVLTWLDSIDTYIQPSMQEGLPRALIEAMSRGCPAIGSTTAGIPELLLEECIFDRGNVKALTEIMRKNYFTDWKAQANRNHKKSKEYQIDLLNERRNNLYIAYRDYVMKQEN